ncbi:DUF305 domain-containing protein [Paraburkholderia sp. BR14320]|uniref:CopM family metallochaperone n=1 Tax=unclassified Paraburkholderia TaxID=2615204 RepID=UPI0034CFB4A1
MQTRTRAWSTAVCAAFVLGLSAGPALAQQGASMPGMNMGNSSDAGSTGSTEAFKSADQKMMQQMQSPPYTGNADKDFVAHMIPHHQGAIDMAEVELKYGKDPELKKLAKNIIKAQKDEIAFMQRWEAKHGGE